MSELTLDQLKQIVESQHCCIAKLLQSVPVRQAFQGDRVWDGIVHVFKVFGHPKATRAYAWSYDRPDGKQRAFAVLDIAPIASPLDAVRAAIMAAAREDK